MGVTSPSSVFSECVVLCVTCRPLTCGPRLPGATPATLLGCSHLAHHLQGCPCRPPFWDAVTLLTTCGAAPAAHPSGMWSPCSSPAGLPLLPTLLGCVHLAHHLRGCPRRPHFWDVVTLLTTCWPEAITHRAQDKVRASQAWTYWGVAMSTQLPNTGLRSGLSSHLPHLVPLPAPKNSPGACDVSWGGAHLPRLPSAVCLETKQQNFVPFKCCKCTRVSVTTRHLYFCPGSWSICQADSPWKGVQVWGGGARSPWLGPVGPLCLVASGGESGLPPASTVLTQPAAVHSEGLWPPISALTAWP